MLPNKIFNLRYFVIKKIQQLYGRTCLQEKALDILSHRSVQANKIHGSLNDPGAKSCIKATPLLASYD